MELSLHDNLFGSKIYTNYQRVALIVLFMRSQKALRKFNKLRLKVGDMKNKGIVYIGHLPRGFEEDEQIIFGFLIGF